MKPTVDPRFDDIDELMDQVEANLKEMVIKAKQGYSREKERALKDQVEDLILWMYENNEEVYSSGDTEDLAQDIFGNRNTMPKGVIDALEEYDILYSRPEIDPERTHTRNLYGLGTEEFVENLPHLEIKDEKHREKEKTGLRTRFLSIFEKKLYVPRMGSSRTP